MNRRIFPHTLVRDESNSCAASIEVGDHSGALCIGSRTYLNGELIATTSTTGFFAKFQTDPASVGSPDCPFTLGVYPGIGNWLGQIDELAIFDADLSPSNDVVGGTIVPGVPAVRFLQMYQMGTN